MEDVPLIADDGAMRTTVVDLNVATLVLQVHGVETQSAPR